MNATLESEVEELGRKAAEWELLAHSCIRLRDRDRCLAEAEHCRNKQLAILSDVPAPVSEPYTFADVLQENPGMFRSWSEVWQIWIKPLLFFALCGAAIYEVCKW